MGIVPNVYFGGAVQSLGFLGGDGQKKTVGVVLPGSYDFGQAGPQETIQVISGHLNINGSEYAPETSPCVIKTGELIKIIATEPSSYICSYA